MKLICRNCLYPIDLNDTEFEFLSEEGDEVLCPKCQSVIAGLFLPRPARRAEEEPKRLEK